MESTNIKSPQKKVGGWLIALILWFGFYTPSGLPESTSNIQEMFEPYFDQYPILHTVSSVLVLLLWSAAIVSIYCAYVLAFKKAAAVIVAKRGLFFITGLKLTFSVVLLSVIRPRLQDINYFLLVRPLVWLAIWCPYLVRSKRVRETYGDF